MEEIVLVEFKSIKQLLHLCEVPSDLIETVAYCVLIKSHLYMYM